MRINVSYIFCREDREIDISATLETLNRELGIEHLMLEGGGGANGALLRAGLVDEISLVISPVIDGSTGAPTVFNSGSTDLGPAPIERMVLANHQVLDGGAVWLRYRLGQAANSMNSAGRSPQYRCALQATTFRGKAFTRTIRRPALPWRQTRLREFRGEEQIYSGEHQCEPQQDEYEHVFAFQHQGVSRMVS